MLKKDSHFIPSKFSTVTEYENKFVSVFNDNLSGAVAEVLKYIAKATASAVKTNVNKSEENGIQQ